MAWYRKNSANAGANWRKIAQVYRKNSAGGAWVKIRRVFIYNGGVWRKVHDSDSLNPINTVPPTLESDYTGALYYGDYMHGSTLTLTRGTWTGNVTGYALSINKSVGGDFPLNYNDVSSGTGTSLTYQIPLSSARSPSDWYRGKVVATNSFGSTTSLVGKFISRINAEVTYFFTTMTGDVFQASWTTNVSPQSSGGDNILSQTIQILSNDSFTHNGVSYSPNSVVYSVSYPITSSQVEQINFQTANIKQNQSYYAKIIVVANDTSETTFSEIGDDFTYVSLSGATSTSIVSVSRLNDTQTRVVVSSSGGSGPYYQLYWTSSSTAPTTSNYDAASTTSTVTEDFSFSNGITYYFYIRSSSENLGNTTVNGTATAGTFSAYGPTTGAAAYTFAQPSGTVSVSPSSGTAGTTTFTATPSVSASPSAQVSYQWQYYEGGSFGWLAISNATSSTYAPPSNYVSVYGTNLRCQITANNGVGTQLVTTAAVTVAAAVVAPYNGSVSVSPSSGTAGSTTFTATPSGWLGTPSTFTYSYSWQRFTNGLFVYQELGTGSTFSPTASQNSSALAWVVVLTVSNGVSPNGSAAASFTVNAPVTCGSCEDYGSANYTGQTWGCAGAGGTYYTVYNNYYIFQRQTCSDGTYQECAVRSYNTVSSSTQINGLCGYTEPVACVCNYSDYGSYHYSPDCCPSGAERTGSLSGVTSGACCPTVNKTLRYNCTNYDVTNSASANYYDCYSVGQCAAQFNASGNRTTCYI